MTEHEAYEPTISVIVPALNAEATIRDLLHSLAKIDYDRQKLEFIIVDGGSTDRTKEIVERYPVTLILEPRKGLNVARNTGFKNSRGEIVLFTDSDCVVPEDWVRRAVKNFQDVNVGCVGGNASRYEDTFLSRYADESIMPVLRRFRKREVLGNVEPPLRYPAGCNMALRRAAIGKVNGFDEDIRYGFDEDELVERICRVGYKMVLDPETTVKHQHRDTIKGFLKQTFNYGRGGALLIKKKAKDRIARWNLTVLILFAAWLLASISLAFSALSANTVFLIPLLLTTLVPFLVLTLVYVYRALKGNYVAAVAYSVMDVLRLIAYCMGLLYGMIS